MEDKLYIYNAELIRVVDGDTADALVDLGFDTWKKVRIRFFGIDAYETRTRDLEEKEKGIKAKERVIMRVEPKI
jgi:micrococcal nuclease